MSLDIDKIINTLIKRIVGHTKEKMSYIQSYFYNINLKTDYNWFIAFLYYKSLKNEFLKNKTLIYKDTIKKINFNIFLAPMEDDLKCSYNFKTNTINIIFQPIVTLEDNNDLLSYNYLIEKMKKSIVHELEHNEQNITGILDKKVNKINTPIDYILYFIEPNELDSTAASAFYIYRQSNNELSFLRSIGQEFIDRFEIGAKSNKIQDILDRLEDLNSNKATIYALLLKYFLLYYIPSKQNYFNLVRNDKEYKKILNYMKENIKDAFDNLKQINYYINDNKLIYNKFNNIIYNNFDKILEKPYKESSIILNNIEDFIEKLKNR